MKVMESNILSCGDQNHFDHISENGHQGLDMKIYILIKRQKDKQCPKMIKVHLFSWRICRTLRKPNSLIK